MSSLYNLDQMFLELDHWTSGSWKPCVSTRILKNKMGVCCGRVGHGPSGDWARTSQILLVFSSYVFLKGNFHHKEMNMRGYLVFYNSPIIVVVKDFALPSCHWQMEAVTSSKPVSSDLSIIFQTGQPHGKEFEVSLAFFWNTRLLCHSVWVPKGWWREWTWHPINYRMSL